MVATVSAPVSGARLVVDTSPSFTSPVFSAPASSVRRALRFTVDGLAANQQYHYAVELGGVIQTAKVGKFTTQPAPGAASFTCAFSGDANNGSNHASFARVVAQAPLFFIHLGDLHYQDIAVNDVGTFLSAYDDVLSQPNQAALFAQVPTLYMWDDHDFGPNNSHAGVPGRDAACEAYRLRVPHPPLVEPGPTGAVYFTHRVGRVLFIFTDQRSMASPQGATDNASKTILGSTQKAWFKGVLSDPANSGLLFVWVCSRVWGGVPTTGADHWGGFTTERTELADHIKAHCAARFCVLSADMHSLAIDNGANHDFATGGGAPTPTFQASPFDRTDALTYGGATYSQGGRFTTNGQFGTMEITDTGGSTIGVSWKGYNTAGALLVQYDWAATVAP